MPKDELVEVVARALFANDDKYKGYPWFAVSPTVRDMFLSDAQAAIAASRPAILEEGYQRGVTEAYKAVCGTNADMCKSAVAAYRLCVDATNTLRVNYPPAPTAIRAIARGEG